MNTPNAVVLPEPPITPLESQPKATDPHGTRLMGDLLELFKSGDPPLNAYVGALWGVLARIYLRGGLKNFLKDAQKVFFHALRLREEYKKKLRGQPDTPPPVEVGVTPDGEVAP